MSSALKRSLIGAAVFGIAFLCFLFAPIPALMPSAVDQNVVKTIEQKGEQYFAMIAAGENLNRPFPEMLERPDNPFLVERAALGRLLFFDPLLSVDNATSCATCHHPDLGFSDNRARSMGLGGRGLGRDRRNGIELKRNTPTIWNAAYNQHQFWDGRARDLEEQAEGPIQHPEEMGQHAGALVEELQAIPAYVEQFKSVFGEAGDSTISFERITYAIAAFERTIISQDSRYDRYAKGDHTALSAAERRGLNLFRSLKTRCFECHNLPTFANPDFKVIGVPAIEGASPDEGRAEVVGAGYEGAFKVPTLRNVALTAPYMHNGIFETLHEVIDFYAEGGGTGLGMEIPNIDDKIRPFALSEKEKEDLIAFLHALTDESNKPEIPVSVPSGLAVVPHLTNQSPELMAAREQPPRAERAEIERKGKTLTVKPGQLIQDAIDAATPGDTVMVMPGLYHETIALDISDLTLIGMQKDSSRAILDGRGELSDGMVGSGSNIVIDGFEVRNYTANGLMIDLATNITFRNLDLKNTGLYGIYPVEVVGVLVENSTVTGARDAGIYVGQSKDIIVRNNIAHGNVTGIEIENSVDALVEKNDVYNNTGGILVFLLPNNPSKVSRKCVVQNNKVYNNNHENFADPNAIVSRVPYGTGIMILGADDVRVSQNEILNNKSVGVAVVGLDAIFGEGTVYDVDPHPERNWILNNQIDGNGQDPDPKMLASGFEGADLIWDLSGRGNSWDEPDATRLPYTLPGSEWSGLRRRFNYRIWKTALALL